jgi:outer membrane protein W
MKKEHLALAAVVAALPALSHAQKSTYTIGATVGYYFPSDSTIRKAMGSDIFIWGIQPLTFGRPKSNAIGLNINVIGADQNGSNFLLVPVTLGYEYHFGDTNSTTVPYARLDVGGAFMNYSIATSGATISGSRIGGVAGAELGVEIQKNWRLSARYYVFTKENNLSFNGVQLTLSFGVIHL